MLLTIVLRTVSGDTRPIPDANWAAFPEIVQLSSVPTVSSPITSPPPIPRLVKSRCGDV